MSAGTSKEMSQDNSQETARVASFGGEFHSSTIFQNPSYRGYKGKKILTKKRTSSPGNDFRNDFGGSVCLLPAIRRSDGVGATRMLRRLLITLLMHTES
mmetsp:Transcript_47556/g.126081  ORF Transcript_47556/g.126081 Transcript_47556/m.126081 type:complete len:99 (-) Transcript_47556:370-666(-)